MARDGDFIVLRIRDDGPGICAEKLHQLFEPFYTTKDAQGGTGLGLSISQRIIQEHQGSLTVESEEGAGAEFTVRLPLSDSAVSIPGAK